MLAPAVLSPLRSLLVGLVVLPFLIGCGDDPSPRPPRHVLLITMDTLRADRLGCYGNPRPTSPALDELARRGALFETAQAPTPTTWPSLTALITGQLPITNRVRSNGFMMKPEQRVLMHHMKEAGYATGAFLSNNYAQAMPAPGKRGLDELFHGPRPGQPHHVWDRRVTEAGIAWLEQHADQKCFTWIHLMDPHRPYDPPPSTRELIDSSYDGWLREGAPVEPILAGDKNIDPEKFRAALQFTHKQSRQSYASLFARYQNRTRTDLALDLVTLGDVELSKQDLDYVLSRYDAEIRGSDDLIASILATVDRLGLREDTLIVFTADHGEELFEHNNYCFHASSVYQGVLHIPLIVSWPGHFEPRRLGDLVGVVDVMPTVLELLGLPVPDDLDGASFADRLRGGEPADSVTISEVFQKTSVLSEPPFDAVYAVRDRQWKLVVNQAGLHPRTPPFTSFEERGFPIENEELYDLTRDPRERIDLLAETIDIAGVGSRIEQARYLQGALAAFDRLSAEFARWLAEIKPNWTSIDQDVAEDLAKQLAALGYADSKEIAVQTGAGDSVGHERIVRAIEALRDAASGDERAAIEAILAELRL